MTEIVVEEPKTPETVEPVQPIDLVLSKGQIDPRLFVYRVKKASGEKLYVGVIALNSSSARGGITQVHSGCSIQFIGVCDQIVQTQG